jgi:hypothetical protein
VIKETIKKSPAEKAFESLYLFEQFYKIDPGLLEIISKNKDYYNLLAYLPFFRDNKIFDGYIDKNLEESQWVIYYNSAADKTNENLQRLLNGKLNPDEFKGYTLSAWMKIFHAFLDRNGFLEINRSQWELMRYNTIHCNFSNEAIADYYARNPIDFCFITFSWRYYAQAFNERYKKLKDGEEKDLALAAFVVNAARVSLVAGVPCEGEEWEKTLKEAGKSPHPLQTLQFYR